MSGGGLRKRTCADHTSCPNTYLGWHEWAQEKAKTHVQVRCDECGRFSIWVPKKKAPRPSVVEGDPTP